MDTNEKKPVKRWLRFSLRMLLVMVTVVCIALGLLVASVHRQERAADRIVQLCEDTPLTGRRGTGISYVLPFDDIPRACSASPFRMVNIDTDDGAIERWWKQLRLRRCLITVVGLDLGFAQHPGECLEAAKVFSQIDHLQLYGARLVDDDLRHIQDMRHLKRLEMKCDDVTSNGIRFLSDLHNLEYLDLSGTQIDDDGLRHLQGLPKLKHIGLSGTQITDDAVDVLAAMQSLKVVNLYRSRITNAAIERLRKLRPALDISYKPMTPPPQQP